MGSTGDDVRTVLVGAVQGAYAALGFSVANGNVKSYLLEEEIPERYVTYLMAAVSGIAAPQVRAWAVQVYEREDFTTAISRQEGRRFYSIVVDGYYGMHGTTPINTALTHARAVRKAIKDLNLNLSGKVDRLSSFSEPSLDRIKPENISVEVFRVRMQAEAEQQNPGW